jgi:hypothetical protein
VKLREGRGSGGGEKEEGRGVALDRVVSVLYVQCWIHLRVPRVDGGSLFLRFLLSIILFPEFSFFPFFFFFSFFLNISSWERRTYTAIFILAFSLSFSFRFSSFLSVSVVS